MLASLSNSVWLAALIAAVSSGFVAYLGYRRSRRVDAVTEQAGVADDKREGISQIIEGQNKLVENLQQDNAVLRANVLSMDEKLSRVLLVVEELREEVRGLKERLRLYEEVSQ